MQSNAVQWQSYHPGTGCTVPQFAQKDNTLSITFSDANGFGSWEASMPCPQTNGVSIRVKSDAPAELNNRVGVVATLVRADNTNINTTYLEPEKQPDGTLAFSLILPRRDAVTIQLSLYFKWAKGTVTFRDVTVTGCDAPAIRKPRIVTTRIYPAPPTSNEKNLELVQNMLDKIAASVENPDLVLFSECIPDRNVDLPLQERAEPLQGPTFELLSRWSKANNCYTAISIHEKTAEGIYNAAYIVGRNGELVGRYRKTHLTWGESRNYGLLPGKDHPVFDLDFGKVGMVICWDQWFGETVRALRLNGAEIVLLPIAGDGIVPHRDHVWAARALENGVYFITSATFPSHDGYSYSRIYDPNGSIMAQTSSNFTFTWADLTLPFEKPCRYLSVGDSDGDPRNLYIRERNVEATKELHSF